MGRGPGDRPEPDRKRPPRPEERGGRWTRRCVLRPDQPGRRLEPLDEEPFERGALEREGAARGADLGADRGAALGADRGADLGAARGADLGADWGAARGAACGADCGAERGSDLGAARGAGALLGARDALGALLGADLVLGLGLTRADGDREGSVRGVRLGRPAGARDPPARAAGACSGASRADGRSLAGARAPPRWADGLSAAGARAAPRCGAADPGTRALGRSEAGVRGDDGVGRAAAPVRVGAAPRVLDAAGRSGPLRRSEGRAVALGARLGTARGVTLGAWALGADALGAGRAAPSATRVVGVAVGRVAGRATVVAAGDCADGRRVAVRVVAPRGLSLYSGPYREKGDGLSAVTPLRPPDAYTVRTRPE